MKSKKYLEVKKVIKSMGGELLSEDYINNSQLLDLKCPDCGEIFSRNYSNIQQRKSIVCKKCSYKYRAKIKVDKMEKEVKKLIKKLGGKLIKYNGTKEPMILECPKCKKEFEKTLQGVNYSKLVVCKKCVGEIVSERQKTDIDIIKEYLISLGSEMISEKFEHSCKKITIKCDKCGKGFDRTWKQIKDRENVTCPKCSDAKSIGEKKINTLLKKHNINYEVEKTFEGCSDVSKLRYDFYIPELNTCIEYDGKQHFFAYNDFGGTSSFEDRVKKDKMKNDFCKKENINLIRITYKQFKDIENILISNKIIPSEVY